MVVSDTLARVLAIVPKRPDCAIFLAKRPHEPRPASARACTGTTKKKKHKNACKTKLINEKNYNLQVRNRLRLCKSRTVLGVASSPVLTGALHLAILPVFVPATGPVALKAFPAVPAFTLARFRQACGPIFTLKNRN